MLLQGLSPETSDHMCTAKAMMALNSLKQNVMPHGTAVNFIKADFHHQSSRATVKGTRRCFVSQSGRGIGGKLSPWWYRSGDVMDCTTSAWKPAATSSSASGSWCNSFLHVFVVTKWLWAVVRAWNQCSVCSSWVFAPAWHKSTLWWPLSCYRPGDQGCCGV